eukprot:gnl/TRDRNA2_/TRDRNA2_161593_c0_seq1.p1 gnl/TRDRNA2_/TRDRNA2_161593_c0~~gnl/TRDRNA2_/TRDRNA2_161593_c0_seq1.p1  ORF type:complete len:349 (-),score=41.17 gnl/TRDRNA2_/TRDRNA2_161593_c0_seq1:244-1290(-)
MDMRKSIHRANGHVWPERRKFASWPPRLDGEHSEAFLKTRAQLEQFYRQIPEGVHHRLDDFEELTQTMVLPQFTSKGYKLVQAPQELWQELRANYRANRKIDRRESQFAGIGLYTNKDSIPRFIGNEEQHRLNREVTSQLLPILESWSGVKLQPTNTYGVRVYMNGSTLFPHADTPGTHIISAILHIDDDLDEPWPLEIEDHDGRVTAVSIPPGFMVLYESATCIHSRVTPMRGRDYGSVFVHYKPVGWSWTPIDIAAAVTPDWRSKVEDPARAEYLASVGLPPLEIYRRKYYRNRGLPLLDFAGEDWLALPVQNADFMVQLPMPDPTPEELYDRQHIGGNNNRRQEL